MFLEVLGPLSAAVVQALNRLEGILLQGGISTVAAQFFSPDVGAHIHTGMHYAQSFPLLF